MNGLLKVENFTKIFGNGCPHCLNLTDESSNICPKCGSVVGCAGISFEVMPNEILGIVGESGSGKSTILKGLYFDLVPTSGSAYLKSYEKGDIFQASPQDRRFLRNFRMGMVYQTPELGLMMGVTAGGNIAERLLARGWRDISRLRSRSARLLERMEIPIGRMDNAAGNFSGGMQQRVQIAKALANQPEILLLDELTTGLDVSVQARILDLIKEIQREMSVAMLLVTHDLGVIRLMAERTMVMKNGRMIEEGLTDQVLEDPQSEYAQLLVNSEI
jgi:putative phosphonate transport system ATP-binding protein